MSQVTHNNSNEDFLKPGLYLTPSDIGAPPACPLGSACCGGFPEFEGEGGGRRGFDMCGRRGRGCGCGGRGGFGGGYNWLGSVTVIPVDRIASFTHNAI